MSNRTGVLIFSTRPWNSSDNKHFTSDLPTRAKHKTLPCSFIIYYSQNELGVNVTPKTIISFKKHKDHLHNNNSLPL